MGLHWTQGPGCCSELSDEVVSALGLCQESAVGAGSESQTLGGLILRSGGSVTGQHAEALCPSLTGSSLSSESSPVSSPATNHSSPASTPKRVPMGPIIVPPGGHSVPSTPPVVTIAPTKTVNGIWRSDSRQVSVLGRMDMATGRRCGEGCLPQGRTGFRH